MISPDRAIHQSLCPTFSPGYRTYLSVYVGATIAERFRVERPADAGGMGSIYLGRDLETGVQVCIKFLNPSADELNTARFWREAETLADCEHPGIVRYLAHGFTRVGQPYLVMEWLNGEDLGKRLSRGPLSIVETLTLGAQVARALAVAHSLRVIHRDVKPGNLLLLGGSTSRVKVVDFGLARVIDPHTMVTVSGEVVGTPGYIAPEQAQGEAVVDERADIYSLGAVLFACLTQRPPYVGAHVMAIIAKLMFAEVPHVSDTRAEVPLPLDALITRMLQRQPSARPGEMIEVVAALNAMLEDPTITSARRGVAVSAEEQRFSSVLLMIHDGSADDDITSVAQEFGARLVTLNRGNTLAIFTGTREPVETATRAARCALALRARVPTITAVLASGRGVVDFTDRNRAPVGQVIDRAITLLMGDDGTTIAGVQSLVGSRPPPIVSSELLLDEVSAGLLDARFVVDDLGGNHWRLAAEHPRPLVARKLLGKSVACIGRNRELTSLEAIYDECVDEQVSRVVMITGPAGAGKSRVCHEFLHRLETRDIGPRIWLARGDAFRSGAPLALLADAIRSAMGIGDSLSAEERQLRILERVQRQLAAIDQQRVGEFLAELIGSPFPGDGRIQLKAAREDPRLMHDQMRRAWEDWLASETASYPVLIVLDDLQWGDLPTIRFIDAALRCSAERPLMVLALARSEVHELFQNLWEARHLEEIRLRPLSTRAATRLATSTLGDSVNDGQIDRIVALAQGNPFYLEELIRQVATGDADELPETVLTIVQSQLAALAPNARRVLRAASVFGREFWAGGVIALVGDVAQTVPPILDELVDQELLIRHRHTRFSGQDEYEFGHALTREAAYRALPEDDRIRGHARAGEWLLDAGETEPIVLAEHFQRGGDMAQSVEWYHCAAEDALEANDLAAVIERAERAIACGAEGETLGALRLLQAEAHNWDGNPGPALACGREAMQHLAEGSSAWANAVHHSTWAAGSLTRFEDVEQLTDQLVTRAGDRPPPIYLAAMARCAVQLLIGERKEKAHELAGCIDRLLQCGDETPMLTGTIAHLRGWMAMVEHRPDECCQRLLQAVDCWNEIGNERSLCLDGYNLANGLAVLGAYEQAEATLCQVLQAIQRLKIDDLMGASEGFLALMMARNGKLDEAVVRMRSALAAKLAARTEGVQRIYWAQILLLRGHPEKAHEQCRKAIAILEHFAGFRAFAHAVSAQALMACERLDEAMREAGSGYALFEELDEKIQEGGAVVRLTYAETRYLSGDRGEAVAVIQRARDEIFELADRLSDMDRRRSFLAMVPEHRRILELADTWC